MSAILSLVPGKVMVNVPLANGVTTVSPGLFSMPDVTFASLTTWYNNTDVNVVSSGTPPKSSIKASKALFVGAKTV